jgi:type I restriction enzyme S subunit
VQHGYIDSTQVNKIGLLSTDGDRGKLENDDLLIVEENGSLEHIGRAALWDGSIDNARHQNHLIRVRPLLLDPRFCLHWLASPGGSDESRR